jgi:hypothetical protein
MRNPVQEYNMARSMPIKALAAVLQGTSDMVSLIAAHTVLREKMEAVVAEKGMQAMQSAQAPKIKDKDLAMAQGLGATPADVDVPMGGIVGGEGTFGTGAAGGGSVVAFPAGQLELPFTNSVVSNDAYPTAACCVSASFCFVISKKGLWSVG